MSRLLVAAFIPAILLASFLGWRWNVRAARREGSSRARFVRSVHDQAEAARRSDPAVLSEDVPEDDLPLEVKAHLFAFGLDNPDIADGFARLEQAIRDHQKGDQT